MTYTSGPHGRCQATAAVSDRQAECEIAVPTRRRDVREHELDGEAVLFDPKSRKMYLLNQTALAVWHRCDDRATTREIARALTGSHRVDFTTALDHVGQLVCLFASMSLMDTGDDR